MNENISFTKKTKRIIALALVLVLCLAMVPIGTMAVVDPDDVGGWSYKIVGNTEATQKDGVSINKTITNVFYKDGEVFADIEIEVEDIFGFDEILKKAETQFRQGQGTTKGMVIFETEKDKVPEEVRAELQVIFYTGKDYSDASSWEYERTYYYDGTSDLNSGTYHGGYVYDGKFYRNSQDKLEGGVFYISIDGSETLSKDYYGQMISYITDTIGSGYDFVKFLSWENNEPTELYRTISWQFSDHDEGKYTMSYRVMLTERSETTYYSTAAKLYYVELYDNTESSQPVISPNPGVELTAPLLQDVVLSYEWSGAAPAALAPPDSVDTKETYTENLVDLDDLFDMYTTDGYNVDIIDGILVYIDETTGHKWILGTIWHEQFDCSDTEVDQVTMGKTNKTVYGKWTKYDCVEIVYEIIDNPSGDDNAPAISNDQPLGYKTPDSVQTNIGTTITLANAIGNKVYEVAFNDNGGYYITKSWTFVGWELNGVSGNSQGSSYTAAKNDIVNGVITFTGYYQLDVIDYSNTVTYAALPDDVYGSPTNVYPTITDNASYYEGQKVAVEPTLSSNDTMSAEASGVTGYWTFSENWSTAPISGYTQGNTTFIMPTTPVSFTGQWEFHPTASNFTITKTFIGLGSSADEVLANVPSYSLTLTAGTYSSGALALPTTGEAVTGSVKFTWSLENVPIGVTISISESNFKPDGYAFNVAGSSFAADGVYTGSAHTSLNGTISVTNNYTKQYYVTYAWADAADNDPFNGAILDSPYVMAAPAVPVDSNPYTAGASVPIDKTEWDYGEKVYGTNSDGVYGYWEFEGWINYSDGTDTNPLAPTDNIFLMPAANTVVNGLWSDFTVETTAFTVTKTFKGIEAATEDEAKALISEFSITLTPEIDNPLLSTFTLTLSDADNVEIIAGDIVVTWTINDFPVGNDYTVSEDGQDEIIGYKWLKSESTTYDESVDSDDTVALVNAYEKLYTVTYVVDHNYTGDVEIGSESFPTSIATSDPIYEANTIYPFEYDLTYANILGTLEGQDGYFVISAWDAEPDTVVPYESNDGNVFTMPGQDVIFTATITFVAYHTVAYEWAGTEGTDRPTDAEIAAVNATALPETLTKKVKDDKITIDYGNYANGYVTFDDVVVGKQGDVTGEWKFVGWTSSDTDPVVGVDATEFDMPDNDVTLYGSWEFTALYTVTYAWKDSAYMPTANVPNLPTDPKGYHDGNTADIDNTIPVGTRVNGSYNGVNGVWTFVGWIEAADAIGKVDIIGDDVSGYSLTIRGNNVTVYGEWEFGQTVALVATPYNNVYDAQYHSIGIADGTNGTVDTRLDGDVYYYSLTNNGTDWSTVLPTYTDVTRVNGVQASITVYVKAENPSLKEARYARATTVTITPRYVTITANSATYGYTGALRTVTGYSYTSLRDRPIRDNNGNLISGNTLTWITGEQIVSSAYGEGRGVANGTRTYPINMGQDANGNYPYSGIDADGKTVYAYILKADGRTDSTGNYVITLGDGTLVITGTTSSYTPPTTTTTTTTPATTATVSLADPPAYQTIGDTTTPLAQMPEMVDIADETVPLGPVTGDVNPIAILICLLVISGAAIVIVGKKRFGKSN